MCTDIVVYDLEIAKSVEEVGGWGNVRKGQAGISVAASYSYRDALYQTFCMDNLPKLKEQLEAAGLVVGFNHINFDNEVIKGVLGQDIVVKSNYDIYRQINKVTGNCPGYKLEQVAPRTLGEKFCKGAVAGAMAPELFKQGKLGELINYCIRDVWLTKHLFDFIMKHQYVIDVGDKKLIVSLPEFNIVQIYV